MLISYALPPLRLFISSPATMPMLTLMPPRDAAFMLSDIAVISLMMLLHFLA